MPAPPGPLPPPITGADRGTWAHRSIAARLPVIAKRVVQENDFGGVPADRIRALMSEIPDSPIRSLNDQEAPDSGTWRTYCLPHLGRTWLQVPWFFVETYFYRRILEAIGYFSDPDAEGLDPFSVQKGRALAQVKDLLAQQGRVPEDASEVLNYSLWGNQSDLSLWPVEASASPSSEDVQDRSGYMLIDSLGYTLEYLASLNRPDPRFDLVLDNVGVELAADLVLAGYLLNRWPGSQVTLHPKAYPTFVSDATGDDVRKTVTALQDSLVEAVGALGDGLQDAMGSGRLRVGLDPFWNSPLPLWEMPTELSSSIATSDLLIIKGDANYRRALGDLKWPLSTPFRRILSYLPCPLLALRTLKSELASGIPAGVAAGAAQSDPSWMTNGRWAIRQLYLPDHRDELPGRGGHS